MQVISKDKFRPVSQDSKNSERMARPQMTYWQDAWVR